MAEGTYFPRGFAQYGTLTAVKKLTDAPSTGIAAPDNAFRAKIQAEGQAIRWRDDGQAPTAAVGMVIPVGGELNYDGDLDKFQMIEAVAGAKANVCYYSG